MSSRLILQLFLISTCVFLSCTIQYNPSAQEESKPGIIHYVEPEYPQEAYDQKIEGRVVARIYVNSKGKVTGVEIIESVHPLLDHAFYIAAKQWRYDPTELAKRKTIVVESYQFHIIDVRYSN